jgi:starvation-inducible DNA-binding protein
MELHTGLAEDTRKALSDELARLLADTNTLYVYTHGYHWNVTGPMFHSLHIMFEEEYMDLRDAVDVIAERIRALGFPAPGSYTEFSRLSSITDEEGVPDAMDMVRALVEGNEAVVRTARKVVEVAEGTVDVATADLATARIEIHEKTAWMLRSMAS